MTIGLAIIARDEAESLPRLLASIEGAFDQVALADTGSEDDTVSVFTEWAEAQDLPLGYEVGAFEWCDDFGAARTYADSMLTTDWLAFADADDTLGAPWKLRGLVDSAPADVACLAFDYLSAREEGPRVRVARRGATRWDGRTHAVPVLLRPARVVTVPANVAVWIHHREDYAASDERDRRILKGWLRDEPGNPRALVLSGIDALRSGRRRRAATFFRRYLDCPAIQAAFGPGGLAKARDALTLFKRGDTRDEVRHAILFGELAA